MLGRRAGRLLGAGASLLFAVVTLSPGWADEPDVGATADVPALTELSAEPARVESLAADPSYEPHPAALDAVEPILPPAGPMVADATLLPDEELAAALEARARDGQNLWPARLPRRDREAALAFYAARGHRPVWHTLSGLTEAGRALVDRLGRAGEDALAPADYVARPADGPDAVARAEAELRLAGALALYARDARGGRIEPSRLSALVTPKLDLPAADAVLATLAASPDPADALAAYNPAYPGYLALRAKLAEIRAERAVAPSATAPRREILTTQTIAILDDAPAPRRVRDPGPARDAAARLEGDIVANMERWRWLPAEVARRYVFVNIPEFKVRIVEDGRTVHEARVITGKPESPTPVFSGTMEYAVVNPSWYVPPSILKNEILPGLAADPDYAARRGYEVIRRGSQITVRQPPGERNALGFIKFMFPNQHAVYLHDTPNRNLFGATRRAMSHGCVRVDQPFLFADAVLGHEWTEARLKRLIGRGERTIHLPEKLPVHLSYFTVAADGYGGINTFDDVYGLNRRVRTALGLGG